MKFSFALGIAAVLGASAAWAQDFQTLGGDVGPPGYPSPGYPPPGAQPLDPPASGPVDSGGQVIGPPLGPDNQRLPSQPFLAPYANPPTAPIVAADGGWIAGAGVLILEPHWNNNPAYGQIVANATNTQTLQTSTQTDFNMGPAAAPLLWLGYVADNGIGLRARWSMFYDKDTLSLDSPPQANSTTTFYSASLSGVGGFSSANASLDNNNAFVFSSDLTMQVADLEILWDLHPARGSLVFGAGVRYAYLAQHYNATWRSTPDLDLTQNTLSTTLTSGHSFSGLGPVASVEAAYPLGQTGFRLTGTARASLLFGTGTQTATINTWDTDAYGDPPTHTLNSSTQPAGTLVPVLEFELGADWGHTLGAYRFAIETALVGQVWFYGGNASDSDSIFSSAATEPNQTTLDALGLLGVRIAASMSY
jgi:hypothetical protein